MHIDLYKKIFNLLSLLLVFVIAIFLLATSVPESTIRLAKINRLRVNALAPEGWAFFTRSPLEPNLIVHQLTNNGQLKRFTQRPNSIRYLYGLNREKRLAGQEFGRLQGYITDSLWKPIQGPVEQHMGLLDSLVTIRIPNASRHPQMQGTYIIQSVKTVPWAWAGNNLTAFVESKICKIYVVKSNNMAP
jgi:antimicrobial peptide system SdpA family protein